jgi:hypothetical protein
MIISCQNSSNFFIIPILSSHCLESVKMTFMDKIIHKVEEKIENKLHNGNDQQYQGGYVSLTLFPIDSSCTKI